MVVVFNQRGQDVEGTSTGIVARPV